MMALSVPAHKQSDPSKRPGQIVNKIWGHFPMGPSSQRSSCQGSLEANERLRVGRQLKVVRGVCGSAYMREGAIVEYAGPFGNTEYILVKPVGSNKPPDALGWCPSRFTPVTKRDYVVDHARRTLRKLGLSHEEAYNVVRALQGPAPGWGTEWTDAAGYFNLSVLSRGLPNGMLLCDLLGGTFSWYTSAKKLALPENYFGDIHARHCKK